MELALLLFIPDSESVPLPIGLCDSLRMNHEAAMLLN